MILRLFFFYLLPIGCFGYWGFHGVTNKTMTMKNGRVITGTPASLIGSIYLFGVAIWSFVGLAVVVGPPSNTPPPVVVKSKQELAAEKQRHQLSVKKRAIEQQHHEQKVKERQAKIDEATREIVEKARRDLKDPTLNVSPGSVIYKKGYPGGYHVPYPKVD